MPSLSSSVDVLFRCDASISIGTGHLLRCKSLANLLIRRGCRVVFFCRDHNDSLHSELLSGEFEYINLPLRTLSIAESSSSLYSQWLGCSQRQDFIDCKEAIGQLHGFHPSLVVCDHYGLDLVWEALIHESYDSKVLAIDDLANRRHSAYWLLDSTRIKCWLDSSYGDSTSNLLLGPWFSFQTPDYLPFRQELRVRREVKYILVFFGGADQSNWTLAALKVLSQPQFSHLVVDVVLGANAPHLESIAQFVSTFNSWTLHIGIPSLAFLVSKADLALGAGGVHSWERVCLGLPAVAMSVADNQNELLSGLSEAGALELIHASTYDDAIDLFSTALSNLLASPNKVSSMSQISQTLVDGFGINRVVATLLGFSGSFSLRHANLLDLGLYFWWVNDPTVRKSSLISDYVEFDDHFQWFSSKLRSKLALMFVMCCDDGLPVGQIRFEKHVGSNRVLVSLSLDRIARRKGLASVLLEMGISKLTEIWGSGIELLAHVKSDNLSSSNVFLSAGFSMVTSHFENVYSYTKLID